MKERELPQSRVAARPSTRATNLSADPQSAAPEASRATLFEAQASIGNFLRTTREAMNLTQAQVAERTERGPWTISRAAVSAIERGQNFPGLEAMLALSNVLHIDPKELIERARLTGVAPADMNELPLEELEDRASQYFWAGDFKRALAVYDELAHRVSTDAEEGTETAASRLATIELRRASTLKRGGALLSALASVERAISLSVDRPETHAEAYALLASLQCERGHLPLASDAAQRAIALAQQVGASTQARAWMVQGHVHYLRGEFEEAKQAFMRARQLANASGDLQHSSHIDGDIGMCWLAQGELDQARTWVEGAIEHARKRRQPALEASWLVELGKIAFAQGRIDEADTQARSALRLARPDEHFMTVFRAEWLRQRVVERKGAGEVDPRRLGLLKSLFVQLRQHESIEEIGEFRRRFESAGGRGGEA